MNKAVIALICLASFGSFAAHAQTETTTTTTTTTKKKVKKKNVTTSSPRSATTTSTKNLDTSQRPTHLITGVETDGLKFNAQGSVGMNDGNFGFGLGFGADYPLEIGNLGFRIGGQTGFYRFAFSAPFTNIGGSVIAVPLAATLSYDFRITNVSVTPFARVGAGLDFSFFHYDSGFAGQSGNATKVYVHFVLEPGIRFDNDLLYATLQFGTMANGFLLMPTFGVRF